MVGLAAGFTLGCVGWGGAQIIKPSLTTFMGISQLAANATSLTSLSVAATTGAAKFGFSGNTDFVTAACIAIPSVVGARFGVKLTQKMSSEALALIFNGASVFLIPTHYFVQKYREAHPNQDGGSKLSVFLPEESDGSPDSEDATGSKSADPNSFTMSDLSLAKLSSLNPMVLQHLVFGGFMGILSSLMGVGGAPLCMSYLTMATDLPHHLVQGTMMVSVLPAVLTSTASLAFGGHTPFALAASVCCGSAIGAVTGS